ncbi:DMT family transporter [Teredinibacter sp. KSP-S5-2]|uniref:DMT family transporter n=1 Tax=Teredinibacter sp. KSP-S5-2 TaxID=3034506 RepID=UPI002934E5CB|nr:DMT family transporter [Teredinibacter sp. KSP-S5-2]WNO09411.1 DMT family transporter [Teredinibacter sp. KSP-S5-2]
MLVLLSMTIGVSLVSQAGVNSQLRQYLGSPIQAAFISFLIGTIILGVLATMQGREWFKNGVLSSIPWWAWLGGLLGAFNIALSIYLAPKLGAVALTVSVLCGQVIASSIFDYHGWLGYPKIDITWNRCFGIALIMLGVVFITRK